METVAQLTKKINPAQFINRWLPWQQPVNKLKISGQNTWQPQKTILCSFLKKWQAKTKMLIQTNSRSTMPSVK